MVRTSLLAVLAISALGTTGCGAMYEDVPVYGQDPGTSMERPIQGNVASINATDNQAQLAVDPGQDVNGDQPSEYADTDPSALTDFKTALDPYGTWADDATYGTVWQPDPGVVGSDFAPYVTAGHWGYDNDYTWVSNYDWGWAPFHYGRWVYIAGRGWSWIPGRTYSGAWVSWRTGAPGYGYVGWGPLAPTWGWRGGAAYPYGFGVSTPYAFCGTRDLFSSNVGGHILAGPQAGTVAVGTQTFHGGNENGRTLAHPGIGGHSFGPSPINLGVMPPPAEHNLGVARAMSFAHAGPAGTAGGHAPSFQSASSYAHDAYVNRPVATGPRYLGVSPRPYRTPYAAPYRSFNNAPMRSFSAPTYHYGSQSFGGSSGYHSYGGGGAYHAAPTYSHSYSHGGGGHGGGHGGHR